jgi:flagellar hook-basal body complex protein FliE
MAAPILPVHLTAPPIVQPSSPSLPSTGGEAFQSVFADAVQKVEDFRMNAGQSVDRFLSGEGEELHDVAIKSTQAELSFDLFLQVRNKVISAYQEVMRIQV